MDGVTPDDIISAVSAAADAMRTSVHADWTMVARDLDWTCRRTLLGVPFSPPAGLCDRTVHRLFPWAPEHGDPWERLLWCSGRIVLPDHPRLGPEWDWWCAPLDEWDGTPRTDRSPVS